MEKKSKVETFIGFSLKAKKLVRGMNAVEYEKGRIYLMVICSTASENTFKEAEKLARRHRCELVVSTDKKIEDIVNKENCKVVGFSDEGLAKAALDNLDSRFKKYSGGITDNNG